MFTLRLFHQDDPFRQIDAREFEDGELAIGRDAASDWTIADPERTVSRHHCVLAARDGALTLRDTSANGVFVGPDGRRLPSDTQAPLMPGETIRLGEYLIVVEGRSFASDASAKDVPPQAQTGSAGVSACAFDAPFAHPILHDAKVNGAALKIPADWAEADAAPAGPTDGSLLDAFCAGAKLDASLFAGEEPAEVMRRLGEVYQQMVLGLCDLMDDRTSVRSDYRMDRTRVHAEGNNPFKWAPGRRLAVDLLRRGQHGFLSGPQAVGASFADLKKHILCVLAGMRATISETLDVVDPQAVERSLKPQSFMLKTKAQAFWSEYARRHAEIHRLAADDADSPLNKAFAAAYERRLQELDSLDAGH